MSKKKYSIEVREEWCKGCAICVEFCPEGVLEMDGSVVKVANRDACKGCNMCELMCPDFAISVVVLEED
jgi:2-oxoglutarate ferredoxin oxidoreductase subunit delta